MLLHPGDELITAGCCSSLAANYYIVLKLKNCGPHTHGNIVHNSLIPDTVGDMHELWTINSFLKQYISLIDVQSIIRDRVFLLPFRSGVNITAVDVVGSSNKRFLPLLLVCNLTWGTTAELLATRLVPLLSGYQPYSIIWFCLLIG